MLKREGKVVPNSRKIDLGNPGEVQGQVKRTRETQGRQISKGTLEAPRSSLCTKVKRLHKHLPLKHWALRQQMRRRTNNSPVTILERAPRHNQLPAHQGSLTDSKVPCEKVLIQRGTYLHPVPVADILRHVLSRERVIELSD
jgi:hypothetical protein